MLKIGFVIIILVFGVLMFTAGILAPTDIAEPVEKVALDMYNRWVPELDKAEQALEVKTPAAIDYNSLLIVNEKTSPLGIQIGLFTVISQVELLQNELKHLKIPVQIIEVSLDEDIRWTLLAAGPFDTMVDVQLATAQLRENYGYSWGLDVIAWPVAETGI